MKKISPKERRQFSGSKVWRKVCSMLAEIYVKSAFKGK